MLTVHIGLNNNLYKMHLVDSTTCPYCESADETVGHFLGQCPAFAWLRGEIFNCYYASMNDIFDNHSILKIVRYTNKTKGYITVPAREARTA